MWKNYKIHVNSNGMSGVRLGESYNLILDALCEHIREGASSGGEEEGGGGWVRARVCVCESLCVPVQMDTVRLKT